MLPPIVQPKKDYQQELDELSDVGDVNQDDVGESNKKDRKYNDFLQDEPVETDIPVELEENKKKKKKKKKNGGKKKKSKAV